MMIKKCYICSRIDSKLFRCKYGNSQWVFLCQSCLSRVKKNYDKTYKYGGTWKIRK